ncbi:MAG: hypothetical protein M1839_001353 [Geoglossum umbratile]|nr:MAG: hypothetical protein M1839_001353 [Geoglossum umbratile]
MSVVQPTNIPDRQPAPNLTLEPSPTLASNNPFRNRAASPASFGTATSPLSPVFNSRPVSRNPFLDVFDDDNSAFPPPGSPQKNMPFSEEVSQAQPHTTGHTAELFDNLTLDDRPKSSGTQQPPRSIGRNRILAEPRRDSFQNSQMPRPPSVHRSLRPQQDEARRTSGLPRSDKQPELNIFADPLEPPKHRDRRPRRNSESSIMDSRGGKLDSDEERRRRRERRLREGKMPEGSRREGHRHGPSRPRKTNQRLDLIDKLDVTSIYGTGLFHHDGPFDACNPHRNRNTRRAPMQAFPKGSANNSLGGTAIDPKNVDHSQYYGNRDAEAFTDFSASGVDPPGYGGKYRSGVERTEAFSATARVDPVHGDETLGLGTSTFLEGAPASRTAMQRRESETEANLKSSGLQRKKSLAQKIRGISTNRPGNGPSGRVISSEPMFEVGTALTTKDGQEDTPQPTLTGGAKKANENNPFFTTYESAWDKKGESIATADQEKASRSQAPSSPRKGLERRPTAENGASPDGIGKGLLQRVKSLKGGARRVRPSEKPQS